MRLHKNLRLNPAAGFLAHRLNDSDSAAASGVGTENWVSALSLAARVRNVFHSLTGGKDCEATLRRVQNHKAAIYLEFRAVDKVLDMSGKCVARAGARGRGRGGAGTRRELWPRAQSARGARERRW